MSSSIAPLTATLFGSIPNEEYADLMYFCNYFKIYFYILITLATILFLFLLYLIFYVTPKEATTLKWNMLNCIIWNYLLVLVFVLWQPIPLFPFLGAFSNGVVKFMGKEGTLFSMNIFSIIVVAIILALLACQTNKVVIFQAPSAITEFFGEPKNMAMTYVVLLLLNSTILVGSMRLALGVEIDYKEVISSKNLGSYAQVLEMILANEVSSNPGPKIKTHL